MKLSDLDHITDPAELAKLITVRTGLFAGAAEYLAEMLLRSREHRERLVELTSLIARHDLRITALERALAKSPIGAAMSSPFDRIAAAERRGSERKETRSKKHAK